MSKKWSGDERRQFIIHQLKTSDEPIRGQTLAEMANVSRQVIVTDIALLKTSQVPIIGTNRGYLFVQEQPENNQFRKVVVCQHTPEQTEEELQMIVDCGVTVVDVTVEHSYYGEITGSLMLSSRFDVTQFMKVIESGEASLLSVLTGGVHLHTLEADSMEKINAACVALEKANILLTMDK